MNSLILKKKIKGEKFDKILKVIANSNNFNKFLIKLADKGMNF